MRAAGSEIATMKTIILAIVTMMIVLSPEAFAKSRRHRHYVEYVEGRPYYNVYYEGSGSPYYHRHYYEDEPEYRTYVVKRYPYRTRHGDHISVHLGF